jgi:hypothetical protein
MNIGKKLLTVILASAVFAGTVMFESGISETSMDVAKSKIEVTPSAGGIQITREGNPVTVKDKWEISQGDIIETSSGETAIISFSGYGVLRLASQSKLDFVIADTVGDGFAFKLEKGRAWINTINTSASVNLIAGGSIFVPRRAAFDTSFDGSKTIAKVNVGQVGVGLVKADYKVEKVVRFNADAFINSYLIAQGSQTTIFLDKVTTNADILKQLLYSKLIKEFQYTLYLKSDFTADSWLTANVKMDKDLSITVSAAKLRAINARGLRNASLDSWGFQLQKAAMRFADVFTFSGKKVEMRLIDSLFDYLYDAEYLLTYGRNTEAKLRLDTFGQLVTEELPKHDDDFRNTVMGKLRTAYAELVYVMPEDPLFEAKSRISDIIFAQLGESDDDITEKFGLVREYINYAYRLADSNVLLSRIMLQQYFTRLADLMDEEKSRLASMKNLIAEENQIVDNLLKQYPAFYQPEFFTQKYKLENAWLALLPEGNEKLEEKQSIINTKIDFLKQLQLYFLDEKVVLADASKIVRSLLVEIQDLMTGSEVAINQLFDLRLKDNTKFLNFIISAQQGSLQGTTMRQKYESYLAIQKEDISVQQVLEQAKSDQPAQTVTVITAKDILDTAAADFASAGITDVKLGAVSGPEQKLIPVDSGRLNEIVFSGQYDWNKKLISNVTVAGKMVSQQPIRLENLGLIIKPRVVEPPPVETAETQVTETISRAEKVSRLLLIQKMKNNDITLLDADITVTDLEAGLFTIKKAVLIDHSDVTIGFSFNGKENLASLVIVSTPTGPKQIEGDVKLADLSAKAKELYDSSKS